MTFFSFSFSSSLSRHLLYVADLVAIRTLTNDVSLRRHFSFLGFFPFALGPHSWLFCLCLWVCARFIASVEILYVPCSTWPLNTIFLSLFTLCVCERWRHKLLRHTLCHVTLARASHRNSRACEELSPPPLSIATFIHSFSLSLHVLLFPVLVLCRRVS